MSNERNKHGLSRVIPDPVKRAVRQRCRFCCVICGAIPYQYHHFNPLYEDARAHLPEGITLLCGACHDKVTRGFWSASKVATADTGPYGSSCHPHAFMELRAPVWFLLGSMVFRGEGPLLSINQDTLISLEFSTEEGPLLNASLFDLSGQECITIRNNELLARNQNWDVEMNGPNLTVRDAPRNVILEIRFCPPHGIHLVRLRMRYGGWHFDNDDQGKIVLTSPTGGGLDLYHSAMVLGGAARLGPTGFCLTAGSCIDSSYPGERFHKLARRGEIVRLVDEITGPKELRNQPLPD
jgi:hypothetical protein